MIHTQSPKLSTLNILKDPRKIKNSELDNVNSLLDHYDHAERKSGHKNDMACRKDVPPRP